MFAKKLFADVSILGMTVPLRPDVTDPYGWQARLALMQCPTCPLETLHGGHPANT